MSATLELVTWDNDRISLDELLHSNEGIQVIRGLTGFGLPDVETRWISGAGNGDTYRGTRVKARDVDLPLYISADDRAGLIAQTDRLSLALARPFNLEWVDEHETWFLNCVFVGGGDYAYGVDTDGEHEVPLLITVRAGQPFWERTDYLTQNLTNGVNTINTEGTAPTPPSWIIHGPCTKFVAADYDGRTIGWTGNLLAGQSAYINVRYGTATDDSKTNIYHGLLPAPKFWQLPGGSSEFYVTFTGSGSASVEWNPRKWMVI